MYERNHPYGAARLDAGLCGMRAKTLEKGIHLYPERKPRLCAGPGPLFLLATGTESGGRIYGFHSQQRQQPVPMAAVPEGVQGRDSRVGRVYGARRRSNHQRKVDPPGRYPFHGKGAGRKALSSRQQHQRRHADGAPEQDGCQQEAVPIFGRGVPQGRAGDRRTCKIREGTAWPCQQEPFSPGSRKHRRRAVPQIAADQPKGERNPEL